MSYFRQCYIRQASFVISWFNRFIFSEKFCEKVLSFANQGHLQALKVRDLMSESIVWFKRPENQSWNLNWKKISVREWIVRKYQLAIWLSIRNFYSHFTKVTRKCECFGCIVEPCLGDFKLTWLFGSCELLPSLGFRCCRWHRHLWSSVNFYILICFSQTTGPFGTKLGRNVTSWVVISIFMIFLSLGNPTCLLGPILLSD